MRVNGCVQTSSTDPQHLPVRLEAVLGPDRRRPQPIYRAPSREAAWKGYEEFEEKWGKPYPAISRLWRDAWEQFTPFLDYDPEIRTVLCSTHAIESLHAPLPPRGHGAGTLPHRAGRLEVPLPGDPVAGPQGHPVRHDGPCPGSRASTRSRSPSPTACPRPRTSSTMEIATYTATRTDLLGTDRVMSAVPG